MKNKKLLKTVLCVTSGIGFATSIPFMTTACGSSSTKTSILPDEIYDIDQAGVLNGFKSGINLDEYNDGICDTMQIPASVTSIANSAFYDGAITTIPVFIKNITFENGSNCSSIGNLILKKCSSITSIDLSNCTKLSSIDSDPLKECNSIKDIKIDNDYYHIEQLGVKGKAVIAGKKGTTSWNSSSVAIGCLACGDIEIPDNITSIASYAFNYCSSITSVDLSRCTKLSIINQFSFCNCSSLTSVTFPSSLEKINNVAFYGCLSLTSVDLSRCTNLSILIFDSFKSCTSLTSVTLPSSLEKISSFSFAYCASLNYIAWDLPTNYTNIIIENDVFTGISSTGKVKSFNPSINSDDFLTWIKTKGGFPSSGWTAEA